jgi:polar amino acid transport system substrate-binding protein
MRIAGLLALCFVATLARPAVAADLRLGYIDQDLKPFLIGEGPEIPARPGVTIELAQRAAARVGARLQLTRMPLPRLIEEVRAGRQDGVLSLRHSADRAAELVYPLRAGRPDPDRHVARLAYSLYARRDSSVSWDGTRLTGLQGPVAVGGSPLIAKRVTSLGAQIVRSDTGTQMFGMLAMYRVDAVVTLDAMADRLLPVQGYTQIEKLSPPLVVEEFYVPVSKVFYAANRELTERFWQALGDLRDATYAELTPSYLF